MSSRAALARWVAGLAFALAALSAAAQAPAPGKPAVERVRRHWWNDPALVKDLSLSAEQRAAADALYEAHDAKLRSGGGRGAAQAAFTAALERGDWDAAQKQLDQQAAEAGEPLRAAGELKIEVLRQLSPEQRAGLAARYPRILSTPWAPRATWARESQPLPPRKAPAARPVPKPPAS
jgi:hypothetical protein